MTDNEKRWLVVNVMLLGFMIGALGYMAAAALDRTQQDMQINATEARKG